MNVLHKSTLDKYIKYLNLRNFADNTINIYSHYTKEFVFSFDKSAIHITSKDIKQYIENYNFSSISQQNQILTNLPLAI